MQSSATFVSFFSGAVAQVLGHDEKQLPPTRSGGKSSYVVDRHGRHVRPRFDNITIRNQELASDPMYGKPLRDIDEAMLTLQVIQRFRSGMTTRELDAETADLCNDYTSHSPDYQMLATRIAVSDLHKRTPATLLETIEALREAGPNIFRMTDEYCAIIKKYGDMIENHIDYSRDYRFNYFGFQTIAYSYLMRSTAVKPKGGTLRDEQLIERPQHMYMRVSIGLHVCRPDGKGHEASEDDILARLVKAFAHYDLLSTHRISHATPTMLNAGTKNAQLSSCFKLAAGDDLKTLFDTGTSAGMVSKWGGGVSIWLSNVRAAASVIRGTGGRSRGVPPYIQYLEKIQNYADQGGNRPGAFAVYLDIWHADLPDFLMMPRKKGVTVNAPTLKYGLMMCRAFIRAVREDGMWYLMCPDESKGLAQLWGDAFEEKYFGYVKAGVYRKEIKARAIMEMILETLQQTGVPYMLHKENMNAMSNLRNVATIASSNLCCEVTIPSWSNFDATSFGAKPGEGEFSVCNLGALCLESFLIDVPKNNDKENDKENKEPENNEEENDKEDSDFDDDTTDVPIQVASEKKSDLPYLDFEDIIHASRILAEALDNIIDLNLYPAEECRRSNLRHRPIGIGEMGLADVFARKKLIFGEPRAQALDRAISAAIYYGASMRSAELGKERGNYPSYTYGVGSPASKGMLQPDLWVEQKFLDADWEKGVAETVIAETGSDLFDWNGLRMMVGAGLRNAYVGAYMPTASTANVVGANEAFEPYTSNIYTRRTLAGEFIVINPHLVSELTKLGIWNDQVRRDIIASGGSIQNIAAIPSELKARYRTSREMDQRELTMHAKARAPFICQTMSLNYYFNVPTMKDVATLLCLADELGLKTISYYMHSAPASGSQKTSIQNTADDSDSESSDEKEPEASHSAMVIAACRRDDPSCVSCSV